MISTENRDGHISRGIGNCQGQPFRVLCLLGGGIRGVHTARILEIMEQQLCGPVARHFDLICGTSIGGILALGLALELPASSLLRLMIDRREKIFAQTLSRTPISWFRARHGTSALRKALTKSFAQKRLGDVYHPVVIPAVDASAGCVVMFKTPHHPDFKIDYQRSLVDVSLATAAAPAYFPIFRDRDSRQYVDGGLVANHPGLCGLHEAEVFFGRQTPEIHILAIGTAGPGRNIRARGGAVLKFLRAIPGMRKVTLDAELDLGSARWGTLLFELCISSQETFVHNLLTHRCGERYKFLNSKIDTGRARDICNLNATSPAAVETLLAAAARTGQEFVGSPEFDAIASHKPVPVHFYYGTHSESQEVKNEKV